MKARITDSENAREAEQRVKSLIANFGPKRQILIRSVRTALRKRFPSANELVYDYPNALVIAYAPTERGSDALVAVSAGADGLRLVFTHGAKLPDPNDILLGSGKQTRFVWIESPRTLRLPEVELLLEKALRLAQIPLRQSGRGQLIIKSGSSKRQPPRKSKR